jgi:sarcosine oxidase, subunit beta
MPATSVAIVGGGIVGCAVAFFLSECGETDVVLFERGRLASGATGVCPGGIRQQFEGEADCRLARRSLHFYESLNGRLGSDVGFTLERAGYLFLAESPALLERFQSNVAMQNRLGIPSEVLDADEVRRLVPSLKPDAPVVGGAFCAEDGFLEDCHGVTYALAHAARQRGLRVEYRAVLGLERRHHGWRLRTAVGATDVDAVVLAAGADSCALAAAAGIALPIEAVLRRLAYTAPAPAGLLSPLVVALERGFAGKQLASGVMYMGWLGERADADDLTFVEETLQRGASLLDGLDELPVRRVLSGFYDNTPDRRPLLGEVAGHEGLWLATGFSGHGFMIAPAVGEALARRICGLETDLPIADFSLARFAARRSEEGLVI